MVSGHSNNVSSFHIARLKIIWVFPTQRGSSYGDCAALVASAHRMVATRLWQKFYFSLWGKWMPERSGELSVWKQVTRKSPLQPGQHKSLQWQQSHSQTSWLSASHSHLFLLQFYNLWSCSDATVCEVNSKMSSQKLFLKKNYFQEDFIVDRKWTRTISQHRCRANRCIGKTEMLTTRGSDVPLWGWMSWPPEVPYNLSWSVILWHALLLLQQSSSFIRICQEHF